MSTTTYNRPLTLEDYVDEVYYAVNHNKCVEIIVNGNYIEIPVYEDGEPWSPNVCLDDEVVAMPPENEEIETDETKFINSSEFAKVLELVEGRMLADYEDAMYTAETERWLSMNM